MNSLYQPAIRDLALIGDQRSCAIITKEGNLCWYCLWRFDQPSLFSYLIDEGGGFWTIDAPEMQFVSRRYIEDSAVLETQFSVKSGLITITDFMPADEEYAGISRIISPSPVPLIVRINPTPDYARAKASLSISKDGFVVSESGYQFYIKSSHKVTIHDGVIQISIPANEDAYCMLLDDKQSLHKVSMSLIQTTLQHTVHYWKSIMNQVSYNGVYQKEFYQSYKAIQLVIHANSGGILAAATTSLPEILGKERNYDYRYAWLRDTRMDVTAMVKAGSTGKEAERFLHFLCVARDTNKKKLFVPFYDLDKKVAPFENFLPGTGYKNSKPIRRGNNANEQMQLDGLANILLAAVEVYNKGIGKPHWKTIVNTANFLVHNWQIKDHGIWEEQIKEQFTSSKVLVAQSLKQLSKHTTNKEQKNKWLQTAMEITDYIHTHCITSYGAYAVYAGSEDVDVTAALYPVWEFDEPSSAAMLATIDKLNTDYKEGDLYYRHLIEASPKEEGVFLAASLWVAYYYVLANNLSKAKTIIDAVLNFSTDLGFISEEGNVKTGEMLGNIPQTFVHASLIGVIIAYNNALV